MLSITKFWRASGSIFFVRISENFIEHWKTTDYVQPFGANDSSDVTIITNHKSQLAKTISPAKPDNKV